MHMMVVQTEHVQYSKGCKDTSCNWTTREIRESDDEVLIGRVIDENRLNG